MVVLRHFDAAAWVDAVARHRVTSTFCTPTHLKRIVARLPAREQTLLFSATMPPVIAKLASEILRNPQTIQIGQRSERLGNRAVDAGLGSVLDDA